MDMHEVGIEFLLEDGTFDWYSPITQFRAIDNGYELSTATYDYTVLNVKSYRWYLTNESITNAERVALHEEILNEVSKVHKSE